MVLMRSQFGILVFGISLAAAGLKSIGIEAGEDHLLLLREDGSLWGAGSF